MQFSEAFRTRLKWAIYDWIGAISVGELASNRSLTDQIEILCRRLSAITA